MLQAGAATILIANGIALDRNRVNSAPSGLYQYGVAVNRLWSRENAATVSCDARGKRAVIVFQKMHSTLKISNHDMLRDGKWRTQIAVG